MAQLTLEQIKILADEMWEGCHGCDGMDKYMWTNGFITGAVSMLGTPLSEIEARMKEMDENKQIKMKERMRRTSLCSSPSAARCCRC